LEHQAKNILKKELFWVFSYFGKLPLMIFIVGFHAFLWIFSLMGFDG